MGTVEGLVGRPHSPSLTARDGVQKGEYEQLFAGRGFLAGSKSQRENSVWGRGRRECFNIAS